jgi:hypothetical protein
MKRQIKANVLQKLMRAQKADENAKADENG